MVQLLGQVEAQKLEVVRKDEELTLVNQRSTRDYEALLEAQAQIENLKSQMRQTQEQLDREVQRGKQLEEQWGRLQERQLGEDRGDRLAPVQAESHTVSNSTFKHLIQPSIISEFVATFQLTFRDSYT